MIKRIKNYFIHKDRLKSFWVSYNLFVTKNTTPGNLPISKNDIRPILHEATQKTGFDTHYIYHPAWAVRIIKRLHPSKHVDISSTLHFASTLSAFIPVEFYDYRPATIYLSNLTSNEADLTKLPFPDNSVESLSCMHVVEHIGLGRYGDPIDPEGDRKSTKELSRVLKPGGSLYFVTPVGRRRVVFNAHRIYNVEDVQNMFPDLIVSEFSLIPDDAIVRGIITNASYSEANSQTYGCGCFHFTKKIL